MNFKRFFSPRAIFALVLLAVIGLSTVEFIYLEGVAPDDAAIDAVRGQLAASALLARRTTETV